MTSSRPIRVLAMLEATTISGTAKAVLEFGREARAGHEGVRPVLLSVANFVRGGTGPGAALTGAFESIGINQQLIEERGRFDTAVMPQLRQMIERESADVVWTNSVKSHFLVRLGKLHRGRKWVAFHHGYTTTNLKMRMYNELDRWSLRGADRVITVCEPFARQMGQRGVARTRIRVQHMSVRPLPIDAEEGAQLRRKLGIGTSEPMLLSVGRLSNEKGHADLVRAFAILRNSAATARVWLVLVGDGPERARLERLASSLGLKDRVVFAGQQDTVKNFYGAADVFVLPSYTEGSPNVLLEAMIAGVPIVATNVGGIPELIADGENGVLTPASRPDALAEAITKLLADTDLRERMKSAGRAVAAQHSPEGFCRSLTSIFEDALGGA